MESKQEEITIIIKSIENFIIQNKCGYSDAAFIGSYFIAKSIKHEISNGANKNDIKNITRFLMKIIAGLAKGEQRGK